MLVNVELNMHLSMLAERMKVLKSFACTKMSDCSPGSIDPCAVLH